MLAMMLHHDGGHLRQYIYVRVLSDTACRAKCSDFSSRLLCKCITCVPIASILGGYPGAGILQIPANQICCGCGCADRRIMRFSALGSQWTKWIELYAGLRFVDGECGFFHSNVLAASQWQICYCASTTERKLLGRECC